MWHCEVEIHCINILANLFKSVLINFQNDVHPLERKNSGSTISSLPANASEAQLKYENDRLKIALAQR